MIRAGAAAAGLALAAAVPVRAADGLQAAVAPALAQLRLTETADSGARLVREQGALAGLRGRIERPAGEGPGWRVTALLAAGRLDYDGRTQAGAPADSHTRTQLLQAEAALAWPLGAGWAAEAGVLAEGFRRRIEGIASAGGLDERLQQARLQVGAAWRGGPWSLRLGASHGEPGRLTVRFDGGSFDRAVLRSGRADGLHLDVAWEPGPGWRLAAGFERLDVARSRAAVLRSAGVPAGTVRQPAWLRERLWLAAEWTLR